MATTENANTRRLGTAVRDGVIVIEVGSERVKYYVHKALLEKHSEYFKKALNGSWKEAGEKNVCLDDVDCRTFEVFVDWLYTRNLPAEDSGWVEDEYDLESDYPESDNQWLIDHFIASENSPYYEAIIFAFENLPPTSLILKALVDAHCRSFDEADDTEGNGELELRSQLPIAFFVGVMIRYTKLKSKKKTILNRCDYHGHVSEDEEQECQKKHCTGSDSKDTSGCE